MKILSYRDEPIKIFNPGHYIMAEVLVPVIKGILEKM